MRRLRWAAVNACMSKRSPEAVRWPCCSRPYHEAAPSNTCSTWHPAPFSWHGGERMAVTVMVERGALVAQPDTAHARATAAAAALALARNCSRHALPSGRLQRATAQLMASHPRAELAAQHLAVTLAHDIAQVGGELKRVPVLGSVAVVGTAAVVPALHPGLRRLPACLVD